MIRKSGIRFSEKDHAPTKGQNGMTIEKVGPLLRPRREDPRDVERLRRHEPFPVDAMKNKMIDEAGLADPYAHNRSRQVGHGVVNG